MLFNSISFLIFFFLTTAIYYALPYRLRWLHLLIASCLFYMAFVPAYILILLGTIAVDYVAGLAIEAAIGGRRKLFLAISIVANVGVLAAFKYWNFFGDNFNELARAVHWNYSLGALQMMLPIGLSFHTFQAMSYTIEVYRGRQKAERHLGIYALYVMFYPQLVAGPIERPQNLLHQFYEKHDFDYDRVSSGLRLMLWGFFKKLVVADRMSLIVDAVYNHPHSFRGGHLLIGTYCFAFQIYCDFSGYTDIARGAARVLGFRLMRNFDSPYLATSVGEFWRRWHISLSTWFKDYLYIPLGGSRVGAARHCLNLLVVFLLSGLWHGASWTFVVWGALHGFYLVSGVAIRALRARFFASAGEMTGYASRLVKTLFTFHLVAIAWIFFRADSLHEAIWMIGRILADIAHPAEVIEQLRHPPFGPWEPIFTVFNLRLSLLLIIAMEAVQLLQHKKRDSRGFDYAPVWVRWAAYYGVILVILWIGDLGAKSFIYFQF